MPSYRPVQGGVRPLPADGTSDDAAPYAASDAASASATDGAGADGQSGVIAPAHRKTAVQPEAGEPSAPSDRTREAAAADPAMAVAAEGTTSSGAGERSGYVGKCGTKRAREGEDDGREEGAGMFAPPGISGTGHSAGTNNMTVMEAGATKDAGRGDKVRSVPPQRPEGRKKKGPTKGMKWSLKESSEEESGDDGDDEGGDGQEDDDVWRPVGPMKDEVKEAWASTVRRTARRSGDRGGRRLASSLLGQSSPPSSPQFSPSSSEDDISNPALDGSDAEIIASAKKIGGFSTERVTTLRSTRAFRRMPSPSFSSSSSSSSISPKRSTAVGTAAATSAPRDRGSFDESEMEDIASAISSAMENGHVTTDAAQIEAEFEPMAPADRGSLVGRDGATSAINSAAKNEQVVTGTAQKAVNCEALSVDNAKRSGASRTRTMNMRRRILTIDSSSSSSSFEEDDVKPVLPHGQLIRKIPGALASGIAQGHTQDQDEVESRGKQKGQSRELGPTNDGENKKSESTEQASALEEPAKGPSITMNGANRIDGVAPRPRQEDEGICESALPPSFPGMAYKFLQSAGVHTVRDLHMAESRVLAERLYESDGFRLGCTLTAWMLQQSLDTSLALHLAKLANMCVERWKTDLAHWMRDNRGADLSQSVLVLFAEAKDRQGARAWVPPSPPQPHSQPQPQPQRPSPPRRHTTPTDLPLNSLLSPSDCTFLRNHFQIVSSRQLMRTDIAKIVERLRACLMKDVDGASNGREEVKEEFCHGIVYSWMVTVREATAIMSSTRGPSFVGEPASYLPRPAVGTYPSGIGHTAPVQWQNAYWAQGMVQHFDTSGATSFIPQNFPRQKGMPPFGHPRIAHVYPMQQQQLGSSTNRLYHQNQQLSRQLHQNHAAVVTNAAHTNGQTYPPQPQLIPNGIPLALHNATNGGQAVANSQRMLATQQPQQPKTNSNVIIPFASNNATNRIGTGMLAAKQPLQTPLSYDHLLFLRSQGIVSDEQLFNTDRKLLAIRYDRYQSLGGAERTDRAEDVVNVWMASASQVLGRTEAPSNDSTAPIHCECQSKTARLSNDPPLMDNVAYYCKTTINDRTQLPHRKITAYDCTNEILYDFVVEIRESAIPGAGLGAFLTFTGARELKEGAKKAVIPYTAITRKVLDATMPQSGRGVSVTLEGENLHGDEHRIGGRNCFGVQKEYTVDDFMDCRDNVTFCSHDKGCGLVQLGRYAPWTVHDRKPEFVFAVKDFVFSFEPSAWRFDVPEKIFGYPQVVDFTSDINGEPHDLARQNIAMYVNEVGHDDKLVVNVVSRDNGRTVMYYLFLHKPIQKGETIELLLDYDRDYEVMRERKGYGKANINGDTKCDKDAFARLQRNIKERTLLERDIESYTIRDLEYLTNFIADRVLDRIKANASSLSTPEAIGGDGLMILKVALRQLVARRRLNWLSGRLASQLKALTQPQSQIHAMIDRNASPSEIEPSTNSLFPVGSIVYVNEYAPKGSARPDYSGIATVDSVSVNAKGTSMYSLSLEGFKLMKDVPEGVLTHPTEEEVMASSQRSQAAWQKQKEARERPKKLRRICSILEKMRWDTTSDKVVLTGPAQIFDAMHDELSEEGLFALSKENKLVNPYDRAKWCLLSISLLRKLLRSRTVYLLAGDSEASKMKLAEEICSEATKAAELVRQVALKSKDAGDAAFDALEFHGDGNQLVKPDGNDKAKVYVTDGAERCIIVTSICTNGTDVHVQWYIVNQIFSVAHSVASLITWTEDDTTDALSPDNSPAFSLEHLCVKLGVDASDVPSIPPAAANH